MSPNTKQYRFEIVSQFARFLQCRIDPTNVPIVNPKRRGIKAERALRRARRRAFAKSNNPHRGPRGALFIRSTPRRVE